MSKHVIEQSEAVLFLNSKGYNLNEHYEAYQAIELSNELKNKEGIEALPDDKSKMFDNVYTKNDKNILRRRSTLNMTSGQDSNEINSNETNKKIEIEIEHPKLETKKQPNLLYNSDILFKNNNNNNNNSNNELLFAPKKIDMFYINHKCLVIDQLLYVMTN